MTEIGITVALLSASSQAAVHMMWKAGGDKLAVRALIGLVEAVVMLPVVFFIALPDATLWSWIAASIGIHAVYQLVLIEAYKALDFSVAYPLARGVTPVATAIVGIVLLDDALGPLAVCGVVTVSAGLIIVALGGKPRAAPVCWPRSPLVC